MPARNVAITVLYRREVHTVTINYSCTNSDVTMPSNYEGNYKYNQSYSIEVPIIPGYIPSKEIITGTMDTFNQTYFVKYYPANQYCRLTVNYYSQQSDNTYSLTSRDVRALEKNSTYNITTPTKTGYTADKARVTGTITEDREENVYYDLITYSFTVHYITSNGPSIHPDITVTGTVLDSDKYIISPAVEGYHAGNQYIK